MLQGRIHCDCHKYPVSLGVKEYEILELNSKIPFGELASDKT